MPKVIALLCEKGGAGKSTTTINVASCLCKVYGKRVLIVDHDPQASASKWSSFMPEHEGPGAIAVVVMKKLQRDLRGVAHSFDYVIIDGAPVTDEVTMDATKVADLVIIPVQPSGLDVWAGITTASVVRQRQEITDGKPEARILVSRAIVNTVLARNIHEALSSYELPMLTNRTHNRVQFAETIGLGQSTIDLPASDLARGEVQAITAEILEILK